MTTFGRPKETAIVPNCPPQRPFPKRSKAWSHALEKRWVGLGLPLRVHLKRSFSRHQDPLLASLLTWDLGTQVNLTCNSGAIGKGETKLSVLVYTRLENLLS